MKILLIALTQLIILYIPCYAEELPSYNEYLSDAVKDALTEDWKNAFGIDGVPTASGLIKRLGTTFRTQLTEALEASAILFGMLILVTICTQYAQSLSRLSTTNTVQLASLVAFGITGYTLLDSIWSSVGQALGMMRVILSTMAPSVTALMVAGGNSATAGVYSVGAVWIVAGMEAILADLLYPAMYLCYGITLVAGISAEDPLSEMGKWVRRILVTVLAIGMGVLALVLSVQSTIAQSADSVTAKTMKFAIGNTVPFVGAAVGESVRTVAAAMGYLRSAVGISALVALVAIVAPVVLNIFLYKSVFSLMGNLSNVVGCKSEGKLLCGVSDILGIALAILISCFVCSVVLFALFSKTTVAFL